MIVIEASVTIRPGLNTAAARDEYVAEFTATRPRYVIEAIKHTRTCDGRYWFDVGIERIAEVQP